MVVEAPGCPPPQRACGGGGVGPRPLPDVPGGADRARATPPPRARPPAPAWLGKTTVATELFAWLRSGQTPLGELEDRFALTELGLPGVERGIPPVWWQRWSADREARPAVWIIDGLDEGADLNDRLLHA